MSGAAMLEEFLRTLVEAEISARDLSNVRTRMRQARPRRVAEFGVCVLDPADRQRRTHAVLPAGPRAVTANDCSRSFPKWGVL